MKLHRKTCPRTTACFPRHQLPNFSNIPRRSVRSAWRPATSYSPAQSPQEATVAAASKPSSSRASGDTLVRSSDKSRVVSPPRLFGADYTVVQLSLLLPRMRREHTHTHTHTLPRSVWSAAGSLQTACVVEAGQFDNWICGDAVIYRMRGSTADRPNTGFGYMQGRGIARGRKEMRPIKRGRRIYLHWAQHLPCPWIGCNAVQVGSARCV